MLRTLAILAISALAVIGLDSAVSAQSCPKTCPATFSVTSSGTIATGDTLTFTPMNVTDATSSLLGVIGGGVTCHTCTQCSAGLLASWNITSGACLSYNVCGALTPPTSGQATATLTRNCNDPRINLRFDYGTCNPLYTGSPCPPAYVSPVAYTATWTLICGDCQ